MDTSLQLPSESSSGILPGLEDIGAELLLVDDRKKRGHTGALLERDEQRLAIALELLGMGVGKERIAKLVQCSVTTVVLIERRYSENVVSQKKEMASIARAGAARLFRRIADEADRIPLGQAAVSAGILVDKADQLEGSVPTLVVEHRHTVSHQDLNAWIAALPAAQPVCGGDGVGQKGLGAAAGLVLEAESVESPESGDSAQQEGIAK